MDEAQGILSRDQNITKVQNTYLRKKVMAEAEDETTVDTPPTEYGEQITEIAVFLMYLLEQREMLSGAICRVKAGLELPGGCVCASGHVLCSRIGNSIDKRDYPGEALLNAVTHRDYEAYGTGILTGANIRKHTANHASSA